LDDGKSVCASFLDFRKAFDSFDHYLLLDKLFQLNVHPDELKVVPKLFIRPLAPCEGCQWFFRVEVYERKNTPG